MCIRSDSISTSTGPSRASLWDRHVAGFLARYSAVLCLGFVTIGCARIISTYDALSLTFDEPSHLACGMEYVANHIYTLDIQNPPLSRAAQALGPYLAGARPYGFYEFHDRGLAIIAHSGNFDRTVFLMRLGNLPFFLLACLVVFCGSWYTFGKAVATLATGLFTLLPTILADAGLATTDLSLAATVGAAFFSAILWADKPTRLRGLLFGFCAALAFLSKATALGYVPCTLSLAFVCYLLVARPGWRELWKLARDRVPTLALAAMTTALFMWAAYWFSFGPVPNIHMELPAPEYFNGIASALEHDKHGHGAFLFGQYRTTGWWYYFPVALALKTPIPFLVLVAAGIFVCLRRRSELVYLFPLAFSLGILMPAMAGRIDIGVRHVEPIYLGLSIIAAVGLVQLLQWSCFQIAFLLTDLALVGWLVISVAVYHPDYLAYFNAFAGEHPENILVDSNYDWGQELKLLSKRLRELRAQRVALAALDGVGRADYLRSWYGLPTVTPVDDSVPSPGWNVISASYDKSIRLQLLNVPKAPKAWYDQVPPTERVGALFLYYVAPGTESQFSTAPASQNGRPSQQRRATKKP